MPVNRIKDPSQGWVRELGKAIAAIQGDAGSHTRPTTVPSLRAAFEKDPSPNPVHFVGVDAPLAIVRLKRRLRSVRLYYSMWQRLAGRRAHELA